MTQTAQTLGRRKDAPKGYMSANTTFSQIDVVHQQEAAYKKRVEVARQKEEVVLLSKAFKIEKQRFEAEWAKRIEDIEAQCAERESVLQEEHEIAAAAVERGIEASTSKMRFKASSTLLAMQDMEKKLARANEYKEAAEIANRCYKQHAAEESRFERGKTHAATKPRQSSNELQAQEMKNLLQKNHALRVKVRREKEQAFEIFKQKYRNLEADQQHAHAIEFHLQPEISPLVQAQRTRSTQASTFRGTLKYESLAGTKFDVPDVSMLPEIPPEELKLL